MTIKLDEEFLDFGFGLIRNRIMLKDIHSCKRARARFMDYFGFGIRFGVDGTVAYNAKKGLDRIANASLSRSHFNYVFHLLGIYQEDIDEALSCKPSS